MFRDLKSETYVKWKTFLEEKEFCSFDEICDYQLKKINDLILKARKLKGYKDYYTIKDLNELKDFPILEKKDFVDKLEDFTLNKEELISTGGSTGIPFNFYRTKEAFKKELASKAFQYKRIGWREGDKQIVFRGLPILNKERIEYVEDLEELRCSSYYLTEEQINFYIEKAFSYKPDFLKCYPSSGYLLAKYLENAQKKFPKIKGILCASENLYDFQKDLFKKVFNIKVFSHYGHYELCVIASYCEFNENYHVLPQYGYAELLNDKMEKVEKEGEVGEIVGTSFINDGTIFIRYKTDDFATFKSFGCNECGRNYQIWSKINGRRQDFILTKTGRLISAAAINMHDDTFSEIRQFQFLQEEKGKAIFLFIPKKDVINKNKILNSLKNKFENDLDICFKEVKNIEPTKRGKLLFVKQKLQL